MTDLSEVRAALAAASPAPWKACTEEWSLADAGDIPVVDAMGDYLCCSPDDGVRGGHSEADAALIASAPSWLAALCDRLDAAEAKLAALRELVDDIGADSAHATGCSGDPDCGACWAADLTKILEGEQK